MLRDDPWQYAAETTWRRRMSTSSGFSGWTAEIDRGSRAMPQTRHAPGFVSTTSGSIGQIHCADSGAGAHCAGAAGPAIAEALGPFASQCPGSAAKRSRQRELQKKYVVPAWSNVPPRGARWSTFMPQTGSVASRSSPGRASVMRVPS
jgi:hypothetical protein